MSRENLELARRLYDSVNVRDLPAFLALLDPELEGVPRTAFMEGRFHGHEGARRWWGGTLRMLPDFSAEVVSLRAVDDVTVGEVRISGHGGESGTPFSETVWQVARWRDGKAFWLGTFNSSEDAFAAAGVQE